MLARHACHADRFYIQGQAARDTVRAMYKIEELAPLPFASPLSHGRAGRDATHEPKENPQAKQQ